MLIGGVRLKQTLIIEKMKRRFINHFILLVSTGLFIGLTGCEKFSDPGLDQETYTPDSTSIYSKNKRRVLLVGIDGLPAEAVQRIAPPNIMGMISNAKYSWNVEPLLIATGEEDITSKGTLSVRLENASGANAAEGSSKLVNGSITDMYSCGPINTILPNLWFQLRFPINPPVVEAYTVTSGIGTVTVRDPKHWTFEGSNDGNTWTVLDRQTDHVFSARSQTKKFSFKNRIAYNYYRMVVSDIFNIAATGFYHQGEWRLIQLTYFPGLNNTSSWASMMTGNIRTVHRILDSTFYALPVDTTNTIPVSPNLTALRLLHDYNYGLKSVAISSWGNLVNTLLADADKKIVTSDDEDTKNKAVDRLKNDTSQVFIAQLGDVYNKLAQYGTTSPEYVASVRKADGYIKELTDAIKTRADYANEEWLVLLTTTLGGASIGKVFDPTPGFLMAYNPVFKSQDLSKMNPVINVQLQDVARQIIYWMKVPNTQAIQTGALWLDRFGVEFIK